MTVPSVTFVVPCYRLAHYLEESIASILRQSYTNFEIIILDDRSPDDTGPVARSIVAAHPDRAITYVLNERNLGNIANYNKGIGLARGRYVWILSPDDRLRSSAVVERYVRLLEERPDVGYVFCPAHRIVKDDDVGIHEQSRYGPHDRIVEGSQLVPDMLANRFELVAASVMIRRECYERVTLFPEDMPHRGDAFVWSLIALQNKVGYFSEAMVDYRVHEGSMMSTWARERIARLIEDDIAVPWRVKAAAEARGLRSVAHHCSRSIVSNYERALMGVSCRGSEFTLAAADLERSLRKWEPNPWQRAKIRASIARGLCWTALTDLSRGEIRSARHALRSAIRIRTHRP